MGGSGSINAMISARGHEDDYNTWSKEGNKGWEFDLYYPCLKNQKIGPVSHQISMAKVAR